MGFEVIKEDAFLDIELTTSCETKKMPSTRINQLPKSIDRLLGLLSKVYGQDGERHLQELLVNAKVRIVEETDYENWNGGQWGHDIYLEIPENLLLPFVKEKQKIEERLRNDANQLNNVPNEYIANIHLDTEDDPQIDWREESGLLIARKKRVPAEAESRIWREGAFRVFLSHKTEVKIKVAALKESLAPFGVSSFVAHEDIHATQEWQSEIESALSTADAFIAILTEKFHESFWTDQEVGYALARGIPIIALRLGRDPYGFIGKFQALSCEWETAPLETMKILIKQDRMVAAYAEAAKKVRSFGESNTLSQLLPFIDRISKDSAASLLDAYNTNGELRGGFGFNGAKPAPYGKGLDHHLKRLGIVSA